MKETLRFIPPVHELQNHERFRALLEENHLDFNLLTKHLKEMIDIIRTSIIKGTWTGGIPGTGLFVEDLFHLLEEQLKSHFSYTLERVINATGTILHTNLGRARLSDKAINHVMETAKNYSNLEYRLQEGERGSRHGHVEDLLKTITGAEAAMIVNNNAAAVFLVLKVLAENKEVIVSRGQLVEIGGSFRISSIMEESGAKLVEVGTTNKTHKYDYKNAVTHDTAMIMKVHTSNFKVVGFTESVGTEDLVHLKNDLQDVIIYEDLGSGALFDFKAYGIGEEPVVREVIKMGADIVTFSGDKLLGGPQAGIIVGKKSIIDKLKKHQLARVLRVDKMTLAALEGTLMDYAKGGDELKNIPVIRDLLVPLDELSSRGGLFVSNLLKETNQYVAEMIPGTSQVGGGTMPDVEIPSMVITLKHCSLTAEQLGRILRTKQKPAIITRIQKDELLIDLRTVSHEEEGLLMKSLLAVME